MDATDIYQRPAELLQQLIRFDTTNPPGNEAECMRYVEGLLHSLAIETTYFARDPNRPNLVARLAGDGSAPPLLLYGHVDVVTTENQNWQQPPFAGNLIDGFIWGRGALDMKGGVAMMLAAFMRARAEGENLPGDVILAMVSDEEVGGTFGAKYLVEEHADVFDGVRYAIGEFGGFSMEISGKKFYPIQVAEKQICWIRVTLRGAGGHGAIPIRDGAMAKLAGVLGKLDKYRPPTHVTPAARAMFNALADSLPFSQSLVVRQLLRPALSDRILGLLGETKQLFYPLLHNTVSATIVNGGHQVNVIPSEISLDLDGRLLPGFTADDMIAELKKVLGNDVELEVMHYEAGPPAPDMGLYSMLDDILRQADPKANPIPMLIPAVTDARTFAQLGIQTYGFTPMQLPAGFNFSETVHAADERIPVATVAFGANAIYDVLRRFGE